MIDDAQGLAIDEPTPRQPIGVVHFSHKMIGNADNVSAPAESVIVPHTRSAGCLPAQRRIGLNVVFFKHLDFEKLPHHQNSPNGLIFFLVSTSKLVSPLFSPLLSGKLFYTYSISSSYLSRKLFYPG